MRLLVQVATSPRFRREKKRCEVLMCCIDECFNCAECHECELDGERCTDVYCEYGCLQPVVNTAQKFSWEFQLPEDQFWRIMQFVLTEEEYAAVVQEKQDLLRWEEEGGYVSEY